MVSNIAAGKFTDPAYAGYVEIQFSSEEAWTRYWCVVDTDCLYIYQNQDSVATVRTIMLSGLFKTIIFPHVYVLRVHLLLYSM